MADRDEMDWIKVNEPWRLSKVIDKKEEIEVLVKEVDEVELEVKETVKWDFMELIKIKGIGKERAEDLKRVYDSKEDFINALKNNKVPLRNDIVKILKEYFQII